MLLTSVPSKRGTGLVFFKNEIFVIGLAVV